MSEGEVRGSWNSDKHFDYVEFPQPAVDGGDGGASVTLRQSRPRWSRCAHVRNPTLTPIRLLVPSLAQVKNRTGFASLRLFNALVRYQFQRYGACSSLMFHLAVIQFAFFFFIFIFSSDHHHRACELSGGSRRHVASHKNDVWRSLYHFG